MTVENELMDIFVNMLL